MYPQTNTKFAEDRVSREAKVASLNLHSPSYADM